MRKIDQAQNVPEPKLRAHVGLPPGAYCDPGMLQLENENIFRTHWQWAGLIDNLKDPHGIQTDIAGMPIAIQGSPENMVVLAGGGQHLQKIDGAVAQACGRFVFVRLTPLGPDLEYYLQGYGELLRHCTRCFDEVYHTEAVEWECNWKSGLEVTLEGYHVPIVHAPKVIKKVRGKKKQIIEKKTSNFAGAVNASLPTYYIGPHSYLGGMIGPQMRGEMDNIAKRLKILPSALYRNYDHFTLFPNMTVGLSGGNLCFMQIYTPLGPNRLRLRYSYIVANLIDPARKPVELIKKTLLDKWRDYTATVLGEDREACEMFQKGVPYATRPAFIGRFAEERVAHFHKYWREAMHMEFEEPVQDRPAHVALLHTPELKKAASV